MRIDFEQGPGQRPVLWLELLNIRGLQLEGGLNFF